MPRAATVLAGLMLFALGYAVGTGNVWVTSTAHAQAQNAQPAEDDLNLSKETTEKLNELNLVLQDAADALTQEGRYTSVTEGLNALLILSGGGDAQADLESDTGVDPETLAALYAGQAIPEVQDHLDKDEDGHVTYKGKVVRMYSVSRLKQLYERRIKFSEPTL